MAGFLYFISEDTRPLTPERIRAMGLGYAFTANPENSAVSGKSPNGKSGNVFADSTRQNGRRAGYYAEQQTWRKLPHVEGRPELWVGYWNDAKPTPEDLQRGKLLRGPKLTLADGAAWQVPIVRRFDEAAQRWESELPAYLDYDESGQVVRGQPVDEYTRLWELTAPLADAQFARDAGEEGATGPTDADVYAAVAALLQANYVVDLPELIALRALQESDAGTICLVACRYEQLMAWIADDQKKTDRSAASGLTSTDSDAA